jgi:hypothetical protein
MDDGVDGIAQQEPAHKIMVADIALDEPRLVGHGPAVPGRQIVENENVLAGAEKLKRHVASDKAHPTRDQNAHQATFSTAIVCNSSLAIGKRLRDF